MFDKYIVRARGCKLEWAEEARVLRRHNARAGQRRIGREMNLGGVCRRPPAALSSLSLPDPSSHPLYRLWLNFIRVVSCNDRGAEVEVSLVQSVQLRFSECKTKGVTYLGMGSVLMIAPFHEGFGGRNPCVFFCAGRSLAQFSQSIKFEGIDAEITLCLSLWRGVHDVSHVGLKGD